MSVQLLHDLSLLLVMLACTAIVLFGWGCLSWRLLGIYAPLRYSTLTVWLGFCVLLGVVEVVHLLLPIDYTITLICAVIGLWGYITDKSPLLANVKAIVRKYPIATFVSLVVLFCWCLRSMEAPTMYDSGLYHFGSVRWLNEYAIVPGLGNLHWRLALNQSYFGFLAILNLAPYWGKGYALGGLFLLLLTAGTVLDLSKAQPRVWRWLFGGVLLSYLCLLAGITANPLPDTAVSIIEITIFLLLYKTLTLPRRSEQEKQSLHILLMFLIFTVATIKLSSVGFALGSFLLVVFDMITSRSRQLLNRGVVRTLIVLFLFIVIHIGRGYLLSGAPFFPSPIGGVWSLPWAVEVGVAQNESQLIYAWAKQPGVNLAHEVGTGFGWLPHWLNSVPKTIVFLFVTSTLLLLIASFKPFIVKKELEARKAHLLLVPIILSLLFWFFTAPDIRFLGAIPVLYFVLSVWCFIQKSRLYECLLSAPANSIKLRTSYGIVLIFGVFFFIKWSVLDLKAWSGWQPVPTVSLQQKTSRAGVVGAEPTQGAQCWNSQLPCAVLFHDSLRTEKIGLPYLSHSRAPSWFMFSTR